MFDALKEFMRVLGPESGARPAEVDDPRVAAAALLFHVGEADGVVTAAERERLNALLRDEYGLDEAAALRLAAAGQRADAEAVDLFRFTSVLKAHASAEQRARFVELLWEISYADGSVHELEDNLIWRIADLLGVSPRERMLGKRDAAARLREDG